MVVGIIRGLSGIDEKEKKRIQGRIDELTILSKPLFSQIKKADDEVTFSDLIMPYVFSVHAMLDYIQETIHDKAAQEAEINKIVDAFDGAYLWSRVKPYYNNEENNEIKNKTAAMETETKTGIAADSDSAMINMLDDITLLYTQFDLEQLKKPLKRHSKASAETRDRFLALLEQDTLSKAIKKNLQNIPALIAKRPEKYISPTDKISKYIFDITKNAPFYEPDGAAVKVGSISKRENGVKREFPVTTAVSLKLDKNNSNIKFSNNTMLDPYCRSVHNAIATLYAAGNKDMTKDMIYRAIKGGIEKGGRDSPEEETREKISNAIDLLLRTTMTIDASQETRYYGRADFQFKGHVLPAQIFTAKVNGVEVKDCIKLLAEPPLYTYAKRHNQINSCDIRMLKMPIRSTEENVIIRDYVLEQVLDMQNEKSHRNNVMLYDTLFCHLGLKNATKQKKADVRKKVHAILDNWVKGGFIKGYEDVKDGKSITKVKITYF